MRPFFSETQDFASDYTALYDFVHGATAALWNTRWQVLGFLAVMPSASVADLQARFVTGSGVHGVNVRRAFADWSWEQHQEELAKLTLANTTSLYEGWLERMSQHFPGLNKKSRIQFPSRSSKHGSGSPGVREMLGVAKKRSSSSATIQRAFTSRLETQSDYRLVELDELMVVYRYFKELRNCFVHNGGRASTQLDTASVAIDGLKKSDLRLKEVPKHE
ncbi:MAG: hypothetical protein KDB14_23790, partial [Planctomycetales bacterium]|nr:hypothetical protein [Planctomycetales bacterium]